MELSKETKALVAAKKELRSVKRTLAATEKEREESKEELAAVKITLAATEKEHEASKEELHAVKERLAAIEKELSDSKKECHDTKERLEAMTRPRKTFEIMVREEVNARTSRCHFVQPPRRTVIESTSQGISKPRQEKPRGEVPGPNDNTVTGVRMMSGLKIKAISTKGEAVNQVVICKGIFTEHTVKLNYQSQVIFVDCHFTNVNIHTRAKNMLLFANCEPGVVNLVPRQEQQPQEQDAQTEEK
ncbi:hypothetical protein PHISCL_01883 [Aspergillus sclerotialis]|uniref:Tubulin-folding cofactor C n=1 Tax=Aspergillus sclerotialis TaxID=2070753 RepID=A0A3A2ZSQ8_9EURO|nr:hypothetical protein PHISCL_01883 [Aspergillus sclerotialis]